MNLEVEYMGCGWGASMPVLYDVVFSAVSLLTHKNKADIIDHLVNTFLKQKSDLDASSVRKAVENVFPEQILELEPTTNLEAYFLLRY